MTRLTTRDRDSVRDSLTELMIFAGDSFAEILCEAQIEIDERIPAVPPKKLLRPKDHARARLRGILIFAEQDILKLLIEARQNVAKHL